MIDYNCLNKSLISMEKPNPQKEGEKKKVR